MSRPVAVAAAGDVFCKQCSSTVLAVGSVVGMDLVLARMIYSRRRKIIAT